MIKTAMLPTILIASSPIPSIEIIIKRKSMEIIISITALVRAQPLPFKRPHEIINPAIANGIRIVPTNRKNPENADNPLNSFNAVLISVLLKSEDWLFSILMSSPTLAKNGIATVAVTIDKIPTIKQKMLATIKSMTTIVRPVGRFLSACKLIDA